VQLQKAAIFVVVTIPSLQVKIVWTLDRYDYSWPQIGGVSRVLARCPGFCGCISVFWSVACLAKKIRASTSKRNMLGVLR